MAGSRHIAASLRKAFGTAILVALFTISALAGDVPYRTVLGSAVASSADPNVRIEVPASAQYVGTNAWVLLGIANCQQFVYVQSDSRKIVKQLYWIQFEAYLASMPRLHHLYRPKRHARLGGLDFLVDTWIEDNSKPNAHAADVESLAAYLRSEGYSVPAAINSGSDDEHVDALLDASGYRLPATTMSVRLVHLVDPQKRKELMIIYAENLRGTGLTSADEHKGAKGYERWKVIQDGLIRRATAQVVVSTPRPR